MTIPCDIQFTTSVSIGVDFRNLYNMGSRAGKSILTNRFPMSIELRTTTMSYENYVKMFPVDGNSPFVF